ncbi:MAG: glycosyltransferase family 4 protein [Verrucomicrobiota bacterium]
MKIAFLTTDNREQRAEYDKDQPYFGTAPEAILDGLKWFPDEVEVHVVSCSKRVMNAPEKLAPNVWFHQPIVPYPGWGRTAFAGCALAVRRLLRELKPDVVHGQGTERDCSVSAVHSGFPNVLTIHGNMQQIHRMKLLGAPAYYWLASTLETHALKRTNGVLCNSIHTRSLVEGRTRNTWLVPNPLRSAFFAPRTTKKTKNPVPVLLVIGVVTPLKRPLEILECGGRLAAQGYRFQIQFIGGSNGIDPYSAAFEQAVGKAREAGYADYLGILEEEALIQALDGADACVHFPKEEAFGLVVAEALARGLRFFGANVGGIRDIVAGVNGAELHDDLHSLENGLARWLDAGAPVLDEPEEAMCSRYHPEAIGAKHLEIYREVVAASRP